MEIWKKSKIVTNYEVSSLGRIRNLKSKRVLKQCLNTYYQVSITIESKTKNFKIHRLVADAFLLNPSKKPCVNHKDGNKLNNNVDNLEWCTHRENIIHAIENGLFKFSNSRFNYHLGGHNAKLNDTQVKEIRSKLENKIKQRDIAKYYNVSENVISTIKHNTRYKNVGVT